MRRQRAVDVRTPAPARSREWRNRSAAGREHIRAEWLDTPKARQYLRLRKIKCQKIHRRERVPEQRRAEAARGPKRLKKEPELSPVRLFFYKKFNVRFCIPAGKIIYKFDEALHIFKRRR